MSLTRIASLALAAMTLGCADDRPIVEPRDGIKVGMTLAETTAILGPSTHSVSFSYRTIPWLMTVDFEDGKVWNAAAGPNGLGPVRNGMTEQQVLALIGKPDGRSLGYAYGSSIRCSYEFEKERLSEANCYNDTPLARRFETTSLGSPRKTVEHYFGVPAFEGYVYDPRTTGDPRTFVWFHDGRTSSDEALPNTTLEEVVRQRGKPLNVCDSYQAPEAGWSFFIFCYDDRERLVRKLWNQAPPIP
jgi:hypothetical protein